jgi:hypothetical protein
MKQQLLLFTFTLISAMLFSQAQNMAFEDFKTNDGTQNFFYKNIVKTDASGNIYTLGATTTSNSTTDILLTKKNSSGVTLWSKQINGTANYHDFGSGLAITSSGDVYITGAITNNTTTLAPELIIRKYNSSGSQQFSSTYSGVGYGCVGKDIVVDGSGNSYITGAEYNSGFNADILTIAFGSTGTQIWTDLFDNNSLNDGGVKIGFRSNKVTVTGAVTQSTNNYKIATLTFTASTGVRSETITLGSTMTSSVEIVTGMTSDASGNTYICGATEVSGQGFNMYVAKLTSSLTIAWQQTYNGVSNLDDQAKGIQVDGSGNVYITGYSTSSTLGKEIRTIKYNSSGTLQWNNVINSTGNNPDLAFDMEMDASSNIYVCGSISSDINQLDYYTVKYNSSGTKIWDIQTDGNHLNDQATNLAIDSLKNIIVTGESETAPSTYVYTTCKYVQKDVITPTDFNLENTSSKYLYYTNKGQLINTHDTLVPEIKFYTNNTYPAFYFKEHSQSFVFSRVDTLTATNDTLHRIDMKFTNALEASKTYPLEQQNTGYLNYFLAHTDSNGETKAYGNKKLITTNLYNNIDLMYSSNQNGIKYYFIVKPGADMRDIKMEFTGATSFSLNGTSNYLSINSSIGSLTFDKPVAYQLTAANATVAITSFSPTWTADGASNKYKFNNGAYTSSLTLVIEVDQGNASVTGCVAPIRNLEWSSYIGASADDIGMDVKVDDLGNVYVTGFTGSSNFPYTTGSLTQPNLSGVQYDAFVSKFDSQSQFLWSTYYGGSQEERALTLLISQDKFIYFGGFTKSSNFNTANNIFSNPYKQQSFGGETDGFIVTLRNDGSLIWATYYGGNTRDVIHKLTEDNSGKLIACGSVANKDINNVNSIIIGSPTCDIPTNGGFPNCGNISPAYSINTHSGGTFDAFLAKFNINRQYTWGTFFGGTGSDVAWDVITDASNSIYITGYTQSTTTGNNSTTSPCNAPTNNGFPMCDLGGSSYFQNTYPGSTTNAYISKFSSQNQLVWSTFFGGSGDDNFGHHLAVNSIGDLYLVGKAATASSIDIPDVYCAPPTNGGFPLCNPGGGAYYRDNDNASNVNDITITKFNSSKQMLWSTFYGSGGNENGLYPEDGTVDIAIDNADRVFITGCSETLNGYSGNLYVKQFPNSVSPTFFYQSINESSGQRRDAFIACFDANNLPLWSTYFGGGGAGVNASDASNGLALDNINHKLYITGGSVSTTYTTVLPTSGGYCIPTLNTTGWYDAFIARFNLDFSYVGIQESQKESQSFDLFPNPTNGHVTLLFNFSTNDNIQIKLFNLMGQLIMTDELKNKTGKTSYDMNLSALSHGMYIISVTTGDNTISEKVIKN